MAKPEGNTKRVPLRLENQDKCVHIRAELAPKAEANLLSTLHSNEDTTRLARSLSRTNQA